MSFLNRFNLIFDSKGNGPVLTVETVGPDFHVKFLEFQRCLTTAKEQGYRTTEACAAEKALAFGAFVLWLRLGHRLEHWRPNYASHSARTAA